MMEQNIRSLQLMMETDLEDFYCENENYAFGMQFVAFLRDELELPLVCTLCLKVGNLSNILGHVNSIGHQVKVLEETIPSILEQARLLYSQNIKNFKLLIDDIAHEIESHLGHQKPFATSVKSYAENPKLINESLNRDSVPSELIEKLKEIIGKGCGHARKGRLRWKSRKNNGNEPKRDSRRDLKKEAENVSRKDSRRRSEEGTRRRSEEGTRGRSEEGTRGRHEKRRRERSHHSPSKTEEERNYKKGKHTHGKKSSRSSKQMKAEMTSVERQQARSSTKAQPTPSSNTMQTKIDLYLRHHTDELNKLILNYCQYSKFHQLHPRYLEEWNSFGINEYYKHGLGSIDECDFNAHWNLHWPKRLHEMKKDDMLELRVNLRKQFDFPINQFDRDELKQIMMERNVKITKKQPVVPIFCNSAEINHHVTIPPAPIKPIRDLSMSQHVNLIDKPQSSLTDADTNNDIILSPAPNPFSAISNADLTVIFGSFNSLSEGVQNNLLAVMETLEANEIERFNILSETPVFNADVPEGYPAEEVPAEDVTAEEVSAASQSSRTDDDSWLNNLEKDIKKEETASDKSTDEGDEVKNETKPMFDIFFN